MCGTKNSKNGIQKCHQVKTISIYIFYINYSHYWPLSNTSPALYFKKHTNRTLRQIALYNKLEESPKIDFITSLPRTFSVTTVALNKTSDEYNIPDDDLDNYVASIKDGKFIWKRLQKNEKLEKSKSYKLSILNIYFSHKPFNFCSETTLRQLLF